MIRAVQTPASRGDRVISSRGLSEVAMDLRPCDLGVSLTGCVRFVSGDQGLFGLFAGFPVADIAVEVQQFL